MVIGCCDSRVSPEVIFDARPGELFVVRNVANLVPPYSPDGQAHGVSAALEFGVAALKVQHIVVLGHAQCGGVKALRRGRRAAVARRFHRQVDVADGAGDGKGRAARRTVRDRVSDTARTGERRQQPRQSDDVSASAHAGRDGPRCRSTAPISALQADACRCAIRARASSRQSRRRITRGCSRSRDSDTPHLSCRDKPGHDEIVLTPPCASPRSACG